MPTEVDPIPDNWYQHLDKGQCFRVVALDVAQGLVEVQHFDGDLEEIPLDTWYQLNLDMAEAPENWGGAYDIGEQDDYGTEVTDTEEEDWLKPLDEIQLQIEDANIDDDWEDDVPDEGPHKGEP